jgi:3-carboxy-cis,cis-muconate cycloisomerase
LTSDSPAGDFALTAPMWSGSQVALATSDQSFLAAMLEAEVALARALADVDGTTLAAAGAIAQAADPAAFDLRSIAVRAREGGNPLIPLLADLRRRVDPAYAAAIHQGATSQDIVDSALMHVAQRSLAIIIADLRTAADAVAALAERHRTTVMASRTLTQHGVPTTFGLKATVWLSGLTAALDGLASASSRLPAQLGGAAGTLAASALRLGPERTLALVAAYAKQLGLREPTLPWHTQRAPVTALGDALATAADALGKLALDILLMARTEIAEVAEPAAAGRGGSSAMPQKQNPVLSLLIAAAARKAPGLAAELHRSAQAVDERPDGAWHVEWETLRELLRQVGGAAELAAELLPGLTVDAERMRANLALTGGLVLSERLMVELPPILGAESVRQLIARAGQGEDLRALLADALQGTDLSADALLDPTGYLGCADAFIDRALAAYRQVR